VSISVIWPAGVASKLNDPTHAVQVPRITVDRASAGAEASWTRSAILGPWS
jgi:hypothetical protein